MSHVKPPAPISDHDSQFFWDGLRKGRVALQVCNACERFRFPPMPRCPYCHGPTFTVSELAGSGAVYSWIVAQRAFAPEFVDDVPYTVATIDFDEGVRAALRVENPDGIDFGARVQALVHHHDDWSELRVRLVE